MDLYAPDVAALADRVPDIDLSLWPSFAHLAGDEPPRDVVPESISPTRRR